MTPTTPSGCGIRRFFRGPELQRGGNALRRHPFFQVLAGVLDLGEQEQRLGDRGLDPGAVAEIGRDRLLEAGLVLGHHSPQPLQPVQALIQRRGGFRPRAVEHGMEGVLQGALPRAFQRLVHGVSPLTSLPRSLNLCGNSGKGHPWAVWARTPVTKSKKAAS